MLQHCCAELVADVWPHPFTPSNILQRNYFNGVANLEQRIFCIACVWLKLNRLSNTGECYHQFFLSIFSGGGFGGKETRNCFLSSVVAVAAAK